MARTKAKAIIVGRLGRDPEMRYIGSTGNAVTTFSVATDRAYRKDDEWVNETDWHNIECFGGLAERTAEKIKKGMLVFIDGNIKVDNWIDNDGNKHSRVKVTANDVTALEKIETEAAADEEVDIQIPALI